MVRAEQNRRAPETSLENHRFYADLLNDPALRSLVELLLDTEPGARLPSERELTQTLNMSRNTLRDRIGRLESMGALTRKERLGTYYTGVQAERTGDVLLLSLMFQQMTLESLTSVRHALERQAAIEACVNGDEQNFTALSESAAAMHRTEDGRELLEADDAFHRALFAASASPALIFFSQMLYAVLRGTLRHLTLEQDFETMRRVHNDVLLAVRQRDPQAATEAIDAHFAWLGVLREREAAEREPAE
ncbi:FCD domain-containing protein [Microbacterium sp. BWT-B31]|uniref:FadR/GntR family transcriptional regulator n=1 Tax=Microbacterium sp. BWT-B31 TaxID=3232072 RepID=UPI003529D156